MKNKNKKKQPIVCFSSVRDGANTQLPAAAAASSNISSLGRQRLMIGEEDKQRAATGIRQHPRTRSGLRKNPFPKLSTACIPSTCRWPGRTAGELVWMGSLGGPIVAARSDTEP